MGSDLKEGGGGGKTGIMDELSPVSSATRVFWNSRKRSANGERLQKQSEDTTVNELSNKQEQPMADKNGDETATVAPLSERRKALFEPLEPVNGRYSGESLLPPPDFDSASYPKGWLVGKKRKLVNVDVVESMRRIAVQEMNRKDREIDGLNEQLDEDARALEHMQLQLLQERSKRADVERENGLLQNQISMLMDMLHGGEGDGGVDDDDNEDGTDDS